MAPLSEDVHLEEAIRTTLSQLCKVGVTFNTELSIDGTIGVTVDKKSVIMIHFSEKHKATRPSVGSDCTMPAVDTSSGLTPSQQEYSQADLRLLGAEALYSLQEYLNKPPGSSTVDTCKSQKDRLSYNGDTPSKMLQFNECVPIDVDSDSASLSSLQFDTDYGDAARNMLDVKERDFCEKKNIIVIDSQNQFLDSTNLDNMSAAVSLQSDLQTGYSGQAVGIGRTSLSDSVASDSLTAGLYGKSKDSSVAGLDMLSLPHDLRTVKAVPCTSSTAGSPHGTDVAERMLSHYWLAPDKAKLTCEVCGKVLTNAAAVEVHLVSTHGVTETATLGKIAHFQCPDCDKKFRFKCLLDKHMRQHDYARPYKCKICHNMYRYDESLKIHAKVHANSFECHVCNKGYTNKNLFQKHIVYMHEIRRPPKN